MSAEAQERKPAVGSDQICWIVTLTVDEMEKFKPLVQKIVAAMEKEPGTMAIEYAVGPDGKTVDIYERYIELESG